MLYRLLKKIIPTSFLFAFEPHLRRILSLVFAGSTVHCPVCKGKFRKFIQLKKAEDSDMLCPFCGSIQRKRLLWLYLKDELHIHTKALKVLHFSPHRYLSKKLKSLKNLTYVTTDINGKNTDERYDITALLPADNSFDLVICYHILEHIPDDKKAMKELYRVIKPGGVALLQVPYKSGETVEDSAITSPAQRLRLFGQEDHVRHYGLNDFVKRLEEAGFTVEKNQYALTLGKDAIGRFCLDEKEIIFVGRK